MRRFIIPVVAAAALAFLTPAPAKAQVIVGGGYPAYYGGYSPYYGGGLSIGNGGLIQLGLRMALANSGWGNYGSYGGYSGGYYPSYYGGYYPAFNSGWGGYGYRSFSYPTYYRNRGGYGYGNRGYWKGGKGGKWRR